MSPYNQTIVEKNAIRENLKFSVWSKVWQHKKYFVNVF